MRKIRPINGLICYAFYSASSSLVMTLTAMLALGGIMLTGNLNGSSALSNYGIFIFSSTFIMTASKDVYSKWNKFQLALPVKRSDVIASKYLGHLILLLIAIVITVIFFLICMTLHENIFGGIEGRVFGSVSISIGASLIGCSLFYPLVYTVGENREEALLPVCLIGGFAISVMLWRLVRLPNFSEYMNAALCIAISVVLFIVSYVITTKIYANKDI